MLPPFGTRCRLTVDGRVAVTSVIEQWESGTTLRNVAYGTYGLASGRAEKEVEAHRLRLGGSGAHVHQCGVHVPAVHLIT